jgi:hypothetical protein
MRIIATPIRVCDLEPGDLFSFDPQEYWDRPDCGCDPVLGEKIYVRTCVSIDEDIEVDIFKITIIKGE